MLYLFCGKYITFHADKSYIYMYYVSGEWKLLMWQNVLFIQSYSSWRKISPERWFCAFNYRREAL